MATVTELYTVTEELLEHLTSPMPSEERETYIEKVETLLEKRQLLINQFQGQVERSEMDKVEKLVLANKEITERLQAYMNTIKLDMNKLKQQKDTSMKYENPYDVATDGFFIDKKIKG